MKASVRTHVRIPGNLRGAIVTKGRKVLRLAELGRDRPGLSGVKGAALAEAAIVCLERHGHSTGVLIVISGDRDTERVMLWLPPSPTAFATWADPDEAAEDGACGLAILILEAFTELTVVERSVKGPGFGFDYWIAPKGSTGHLFQNRARLEVSGTNLSDENSFRQRIRRKTLQTMRSDSMRVPAFVAVVGFAKPRSYFAKRRVAP